MNANLERAYQNGRARGVACLVAAHRQRITSYASLLASQLHFPVAELVAKVVAYDQERLDAVPSLATYPELRGYRDRIDAEDSGLRDAGVQRGMIAMTRTLDFYTRTRLYQETGRAFYAEPGIEECRILFVPHGDPGPIHAKNVDGTIEDWTPLPPVGRGTPWPFPHPLMFDGVASGLHIDEIPPEIFPVSVWDLCREHCTRLNAATEFLARYNFFWSSGNLLLFDQQGDSIVFEKTQCRFAIRGPNQQGITFTSGMDALDPGIREHQRRMRQKYLDQIGSSWDGPEARFWQECERTHTNMAARVEQLPARPTLEQVNELMERHDRGAPLCFVGEKSHPGQPAGCWTLEMRVYLPNEKKCIRRQVRDGKPAFMDTPEIIEYGLCSAR